MSGIIVSTLVIAWFLGLCALVAMIVFYEWRRKQRIARGLPVDDRQSDVEPRGFEVEITATRD